MDNVAGMTGGGQEGASPCAVDAAGMTGEGGQEGGPCTAIPLDDGAGMIGEGCQEENLSPSQDNSSPMVSPSIRGVKGEQVTHVWSSFGL